MQVHCLGILVTDIIVKTVDRYPVRGKLRLVDDIKLCSGGCAANTGIDLAKLGVKTRVMGKLGEDGFGDFLINTCRKHGLDVQGIVRDNSVGTSTTIVMVHSDGERSFLHSLGANAQFCEDDININLLIECQILHIAGFFLLPKLDGLPVASLLKKAKETGTITSLDTAWDARGRWMKLLEPCLPYLDIFLPSIEEARMITDAETVEEIAKILIDKGVKIVGLKMGKEGCYIRTKSKKIRIPAYPVEVIDTTGAGDAFVAGFLTGILKKWPLEKTGRLANAAGALSTTAIGATDGLISLEKTLEFMNK